MAALFTLMRTTDPETTVRDSSWIVVNAVVDSDANCIGVFNLEYCCVCHGYDCQTWYAFTIPAPGMICGVTLFCYRNLINARIHCLTLSLARFTAHPCVRHAMHTLVTVDDSHLPELLRLGMLDVAKQFVQGQDRQLQLHGMSTLTQLLAVGTPCHVLSCVVLCGLAWINTIRAECIVYTVGNTSFLCFLRHLTHTHTDSAAVALSSDAPFLEHVVDMCNTVQTTLPSGSRPQSAASAKTGTRPGSAASGRGGAAGGGVRDWTMVRYAVRVMERLTAHDIRT